MSTRATILTALLLIAVPAAAEQYSETNPLYDLNVDYRFEGDRFTYDLEFKNRLEIQVLFDGLDVSIECESGKKDFGRFTLSEYPVPANTALTHGGSATEGVACSPTTRWNPNTKTRETVPNSIVAIKPVRVAIHQEGTSPGNLEWSCGEKSITVGVVKFKKGPSFRLVATNGRSMVSRPETFKAGEAIAHLCGHTVSDPDRVTEGVHTLMEKWRAFCERAPQFCDRAYDVENKRVGGVRG